MACFISVATRENKGESEDGDGMPFFSDRREPGSGDNASEDEAVLYAFLSSPYKDSFWATLGGPILGPLG